MDNNNRTIRAPSTLIKSSKISAAFNGNQSTAQSKLRLLNLPSLTATKTTSTTTNLIRAPLANKVSGLVKPTPVRHIISAATTTTTTTKVAAPPPVGTRTATKRPSKASPSSSSSTISRSIRLPTVNPSGSGSSISSGNSSITKLKPPPSAISASSSCPGNTVEKDVSELRHLLEKLYNLIERNSQDNHEILEENKRLKSELAQLKDPISSAMKSSSGLEKNSQDNREILEENTRLKNEVAQLKDLIMKSLTAKSARNTSIQEESQVPSSTYKVRDKRQFRSSVYYTPMN